MAEKKTAAPDLVAPSEKKAASNADTLLRMAATVAAGLAGREDHTPDQVAARVWPIVLALVKAKPDGFGDL